MIASPTPDYDGPLKHRTYCQRAKRWSTVPWVIDGVLVYVEDIDAHYIRAKEEGARILSALEDGPPRVATVLRTWKATVGCSWPERKIDARAVQQTLAADCAKP